MLALLTFAALLAAWILGFIILPLTLYWQALTRESLALGIAAVAALAAAIVGWRKVCARFAMKEQPYDSGGWFA